MRKVRDYWKSMRHTRTFFLSLVVGVTALLQLNIAFSAAIPDVRNTLHNLSTKGPGPVKAATETQVCVFCHTPHAANNEVVAPLWNRKLSNATYTTYSSSSIDANISELAQGPGGSSKLCLSCHDGTMALGNVNVLNGQAEVSIEMTGTDGGKMPGGKGATTGFTRNIGVNLTNDHPISFTYNDAVAEADGELRKVTGSHAVGNASTRTGYKPQFPLQNGKMQCTTCHDPHLWESDVSMGTRKFLRGNRYQKEAPSGGEYNANTDIVCLACHDRGGQAWSNSAHANPAVADEKYLLEASKLRDFPKDLPVWKASCQNCHDTHTVQGSRRLLREGTDSTATPKEGGKPAIEQTCYQCHSAAGTSVLQTLNTVPNIKSAFDLPYRMPISNADQNNTTEVHDIGTGTGKKRGADFIEGQLQLGHGNLNNRHAECTDCHNPHRVVRNHLFYGNGGNTTVPDAYGTHRHEDDSQTKHTNIASGVLRGTYGVEPKYSSNSFYDMPTSFDVKRGDPGNNTSTDVSASYVTREYQICLKCHSNFGYDDNNIYPNGNRPTLSAGGGTPAGTFGLTMFTNQAREFNAPVSHRGEPLNMGVDGGANSSWNTNNHRGWHPVMGPTGRTAPLRGMDNTSAFLAPWNNDIGNQTMFCSDCHGSNTPDRTVIPMGGQDGEVWGPHGSTNPFLLKGRWLQTTMMSYDDAFLNNLVCFKCHDRNTYAGRKNTGKVTGFYAQFIGFDMASKHTEWNDGGKAEEWDGGGSGNLHNYHAWLMWNTPKYPPGFSVIFGTGYEPQKRQMRCTWCHVAVPHGWKNKALLVNLNDVGGEAGYPGRSMEATISATGLGPVTSETYTQEPYYYKSILKVKNFAPSGNWKHMDCASAGKTGGELIPGQGVPSWDGKTVASVGTTTNFTQFSIQTPIGTVTPGLQWMMLTCRRPP